MNDKELLELAAKAIKKPRQMWDYEWCRNHGHMVTKASMWNPLTDDGDALRLAVKLNIVIWEYYQYERAMAEVRYGTATGEYWELGEDKYAATRRAIVRAAAEIGKNAA